MSKEETVVIERLTKKFGDFTALDDLSLTIGAGEVLGLIGPNGAGKSTTIRILVGLLLPTSGTARIAGSDCVADARRIKHLVGYMPDAFGSYDNMRVHEYLDFFGAAFGIPRRRRSSRIAEVFEITGTSYMRDNYVDSLSHGMAQRLGVARTLLHDPKVLILDEPANGLDPQARIEMRELMLQLAASGKTLLVTSHILPELARICDRIAILISGRLRAYGTVAEIGRQVSRQRTIEVQLLSAEQVAAAAAIIEGSIEPGAQVVQSAAEAAVRFRTTRGEGELGDLLAELVRGQIAIAQFREVHTDLESAYMSFALPSDGNVSAIPESA